MRMEKGIPIQFHSDGGAPFASRDFSHFREDWGITYLRSSPHHHQANGTAEAAVKSIKNLTGKST